MMSRRLLKTVMWVSSLVLLTACGGEGTEEDSSTNGTSSNQSSNGGENNGGSSSGFKDSHISGVTYYAITPDKTVFTFKFKTDKSMTGGPGYLTSGDSEYYKSGWSIDNGKVILPADDSKFAFAADQGDYISVCESSIRSSEECSASELQRWYTDKTKAKAYAQAGVSGSQIDFSLITDAKLKSHIQALDYDNLEQVRILYANGAEIESIAGLGQFSNLKKIYLAGNRITDLSPIKDLTSLDGLQIPDQVDSNGKDLNFADYSPLMNLTSLRKLEFTEYGTTTIPTKFELDTYLSGHQDVSKIRYLILRDLPLDQNDINAINGLNSLERLVIDESENDLSFDILANQNNLSRLKRLELGLNGQNFSAFDLDLFVSAAKVNFHGLEHLALAKTSLSNAELATLGKEIGDSSALRQLDLRDLGGATDYDLGDTFKAPNLERLRLALNGADYDMKVGTEGGSFTPSKLKQLYLEDGNIHSFTLSHYTNLQRLRVRGSNLSDTTVDAFVTALNGLSNLSQLRIKGSKVAGSAISCTDLSNAGLTKTSICDDTK